MIVLNISCANGHQFEGWFASREIFGEQVALGLIECLECGSTRITALPSGPHVKRRALETTGAFSAEALPTGPSEKLIYTESGRKIFMALAALARSAENVGERFTEEARRIHYEEIPARNIRGIASRDEARELLDEGIFVLPAPIPPENETH